MDFASITIIGIRYTIEEFKSMTYPETEHRTYLLCDCKNDVVENFCPKCGQKAVDYTNEITFFVNVPYLNMYNLYVQDSPQTNILYESKCGKFVYFCNKVLRCNDNIILDTLLSEITRFKAVAKEMKVYKSESLGIFCER
jgi:hypothetical protein